MNQKTSTDIIPTKYIGVWIAVGMILLWSLNLAVGLQLEVSVTSPLVCFIFLLQIHLYTGLFITAHDAMHHSILPTNKRINDAIGRICTFLYAFFPYQELFEKHHKHHRFVQTEEDPDYHEGSFWTWYGQFLLQYLTIGQFVAYAITFNVLQLFIPIENLLIFWIAPAILSTFQLFYFGTYLPHKGEHDNPHYSRSQAKNHWWAFLSCYFFGYHYEHHDQPNVPWWRLWRVKEGGR